MAIYAIGDIQGCYRSLKRLLGEIGFDRRRDRLWLAGDLVNRGPRSADVLRWACDLDDRVVAVLGNHDLHLLARRAGLRKHKPMDTLDDVIDAADGDELIDWLRARPLMHRQKGFALIHAGLHPDWSIARAAALARQVEDALRGDDWPEQLAEIYGRKPTRWRPDLEGARRLRAISSVFVSARCIDEDGRLVDYSGPPERAPAGSRPWYELREDDPAVLLFGHWAMMGHRMDDAWISLDSGCVWGNQLTAVRLEDRAVFQVDDAD